MMTLWLSCPGMVMHVKEVAFYSWLFAIPPSPHLPSTHHQWVVATLRHHHCLQCGVQTSPLRGTEQCIPPLATPLCICLREGGAQHSSLRAWTLQIHQWHQSHPINRIYSRKNLFKTCIHTPPKLVYKWRGGCLVIPDVIQAYSRFCTQESAGV